MYSFLENNDDEFSLETAINKTLENELNFVLMLEETDYESTTTSAPGYWSDGMYYGGGSSKQIVHSIQARLYSVSDTTEIWRAEIEIKKRKL